MRRAISFAFLTLIAGLFSGIASAQETPPYGAPISYESAKKVMAAAEKEAMDNGWNVAITVLDSGGHVMLSQRFDNTSYGSLRISESKARTALEFRNATKVYQDTIAAGGAGLRLLSVPDAVFLQGGILIVEDGVIVGSIGASGVTSAQDEQVSLAGAAAVK
jgi:glc operon protein GlcG